MTTKQALRWKALNKGLPVSRGSFFIYLIFENLNDVPYSGSGQKHKNGTHLKAIIQIYLPLCFSHDQRDRLERNCFAFQLAVGAASARSSTASGRRCQNIWRRWLSVSWPDCGCQRQSEQLSILFVSKIRQSFRCRSGAMHNFQADLGTALVVVMRDQTAAF